MYMLPSKAQIYPEVNTLKDKEYLGYDDSFSIKWGKNEKIELIKRLGRGKYSDVFQAVDSENDVKCVVKCLKPIMETKIKREIKILLTLKGGENIINLLDFVKCPLTNGHSLIFEYVNCSTWKDERLRICNIVDTTYFVCELLRALDYCHSKGIMHRDVKPHNVLIDYNKRKLKLIDWGLADFYHPYKEYNVRVASRNFKGPELLVCYPMYNYSLDLWAVGCMLAGLLLRKDPVFQGSNNLDQLLQIVKVLGSDELFNYLLNYNIQLKPKIKSMLKGYRKKPWEYFIKQDIMYSNKALDLLSKLLCFDHNKRLTAREALLHPLFSDL